jgi:hypothetical protein
MPPGAAQPQVLDLGRHRFADLVGQHEGGFVLNVEIARQRERRLAFYLVAEDHDRRQVVADLQLVESEQGARGRAEVAPAGRAAEPRRPIGPRAGPARRTSALGADRRPSGQRIEQNIAQASSIRRICFRLTVRAAAVRRKCCDMGDLRVRRSPESTAIVPLRKRFVHFMFLFVSGLSESRDDRARYFVFHPALVAADT